MELKLGRFEIILADTEPGSHTVVLLPSLIFSWPRKDYPYLDLTLAWMDWAIAIRWLV